MASKIIFYPEYDLREPPPQLLKNSGYQEYMTLWHTFQWLLGNVLKRNQYVEQTREGQTVKVIPRLESLEQTEELQEYIDYHVGLWERMEDTMRQLSKNKYAQAKMRGMREREIYLGLYDMINY